MLNQHLLKRIRDYQRLKVYGKTLPAPYYINNFQKYLEILFTKANIQDSQKQEILDMYRNREIPYGWYRGKGEPEELESAVPEIAEQVRFDLSGASEYGIAEFMKLFGLGIDCSGFVFNVLKYAFEKEGRLEDLLDQLDWLDKDYRTVNNAGVFVFASKKLKEVSPEEIKPLDLLLIKGKEKYVHIGIVYEEDSKLFVAESTINSFPTGVHITSIIFENGYPQFKGNRAMGKGFNKLIEEGVLEIRRLNEVQK